jgi:hypothetical protein
MERNVVAGGILRRVAAGFGDEVESGLVVNSHFVFRSVSCISRKSRGSSWVEGKLNQRGPLSLVSSSRGKRGRKQRLGGENDTTLIASGIRGKATTKDTCHLLGLRDESVSFEKGGKGGKTHLVSVLSLLEVVVIRRRDVRLNLPVSGGESEQRKKKG